jgi:excisionase family DNA binding protein
VTERLVDAAVIAELLSVPKGWVLEQARNGVIPHVRLGRYVRFDADEVRAWVASLSSGGGPSYRKHRPLVSDRGEH